MNTKDSKTNKKSFYQWITEEKGYTELEAQETVFRLEFGLKIPNKVKEDWEEYTKIKGYGGLY